MYSKLSKMILVLILIFGFFLRLAGINFGLPSKNLALTTYNPDEPLSYQVIEKWNPKKLDFHPRRVFLWGGFHLYPLAASLTVAKVLGYIRLGNRDFYIKNLSQADKLYIVGRFMMILFATGTILIFFIILKKNYGLNFSLISTLLLSILPVHFVNSIYVRPDVMMLFFGCVTIYFGTKIFETKKMIYYFLSCLSVGFATGTKLSGAVFGIVPVVAHFLFDEKIEKKILDYKLYVIPIICVLGLVISSPYILIDFNTTSESFWNYFKINFSLSKGMMEPAQKIIFGEGVLSYLKGYLIFGCGQVIVFFSMLGFLLMSFKFIIQKVKNKDDLFFLICGFVILYVISSTKNQAVWYTIPFIPFLIIYAVRSVYLISEFIKNEIVKKIIFISMVIILLSYSFVYSIATWKLYFEKNVREECSEWIEKNIPKGAKVAIARSYFWTPAILRQYNPPYKILYGRDFVDSEAFGGLKGLEKVLFDTDYLVLTEYEYRNVLHQKLKKYYLDQENIAKEIFFNKKFDIVAEFKKEPKFLFFNFSADYVPVDWLIPNPKIIIFKNQKK